MVSLNLQHRRTHNLLLISKLLNQRETTSPFTLIIDTLEQSGKPLLREYIKRANAAKNEVLFLSFETLRKPPGVGIFIPAYKESFANVQRTVAAHIGGQGSAQKKVLIIDTLNPLCSDPATSSNLPAILSSFFAPNVSLIAIYHDDVPVSTQSSPYNPAPLTMLKYLATTIFTTHSLHHILAQKAARDRSLAEPVFGLEQGTEGVLLSQHANGKEGLVLEMEYRRKSGRGVKEWYFLPHPLSPIALQTTKSLPGRGKETVILLEDHPLYRRPEQEAGPEGAGEGDMDVTFNLGLTERQREAREGVVLPYFDAQKGGGEGGRILYDMGEEDDFDEEEDEI